MPPAINTTRPSSIGTFWAVESGSGGPGSFGSNSAKIAVGASSKMTITIRGYKICLFNRIGVGLINYLE